FVLFCVLLNFNFSMAESHGKEDLSLRAGVVFPKYFYFMEGKGSGISNAAYNADRGLFLELSRPLYKGLETITGLQILSQSFDVKTYQKYYYEPIKIKHSVSVYVVNIGLSQAVFKRKYLNVNVTAGLMPTRISDYRTKIYTDSGNVVNLYNRYRTEEVKSTLLTWYAGVEMKKKIYKELYGMVQGSFVFQTTPNKQTVLYTINRFNMNLGLVYRFLKK
ncbi:MAG TPA: hypothetical protein VGF79_01545, partial [Bacteroidia bacterium]